MNWAASAAPSIDATFVPARSPSVDVVDADGEAVLLDRASDALHLLNQTAALVWRCYDGVSSLADIAADVADVLAAPFERVLADVVTVTENLRGEGLVVDGRHRPRIPLVAVPRDSADAQADGHGMRVLPEPPNT